MADTRVFRSAGLIVAAALLVVVSAGLIWMVAVPFGSGVCPAVDPAPLHCSPAQRAGTGLMATICIVAIGALTLGLGIWGGRRARPLVVGGVVVLALAPVVTYAAVSFSPGFQIA